MKANTDSVEDAAEKLFDKGCKYQLRGKHRKAIQYFDQAIAMGAGTTSYLSSLGLKGRSLMSLGKPRDAIQTLTIAIEDDPDYRSAWLIRGEAHCAIKKYDAAMRDMCNACGDWSGVSPEQRQHAYSLLHDLLKKNAFVCEPCARTGKKPDKANAREIKKQNLAQVKRAMSSLDFKHYTVSHQFSVTCAKCGSETNIYA